MSDHLFSILWGIYLELERPELAFDAQNTKCYNMLGTDKPEIRSSMFVPRDGECSAS